MTETINHVSETYKSRAKSLSERKEQL